MNTRIVFIILGISGIGFGLWHWLTDRSDAHGISAYTHTLAILEFGPRTVESDGLKKSQQYIAEQLSMQGWSTMTQQKQRDTPEGKHTFTNLIARYQPDKLTTLDDLLKLPTKGILCAHLDSKKIPGIPDFLGADDAASACALIIELATTLGKENPELAKGLEIVFFDGEEAFGENITPEDGLYGSRFYAHTLYQRKPKPEFGILLDMVGHKDLKIAVPSDSPPKLYESMLRAAKEHGYEKHYNMAEHPIIDDHVYMNKAGVPTIDIIGKDFAHSHWWHQEGDNIDLISASSLTISYHVVLTMLREQLAAK